MKRALLCSCVLAVAAAPQQPDARQSSWSGFASNAQHTGVAPAAASAPALQSILWQTTLDRHLATGNAGGHAHYASPLVTAAGTIILAVKTEVQDGWRIHAEHPDHRRFFWHLATDYRSPPHDWALPFPMALTPQNSLVAAAAAGTVLVRRGADQADGGQARLAFYGRALYLAHPDTLAGSVMIDTPITSDAAGNVFFGFVAAVPNPAGISSGIARISSSGAGSWISAANAARDAGMTQVAMGSAPALSPDGATLYVAVSNGASGKLLGLDARTLAPKYQAALVDPASGYGAWISNDSSASPTVAPDGDVYFGVLENPFPNHNDRGWLLHFDAALAHAKTPGTFGWDQTVSVLPASAVPSYKGLSPYLLVCQANNYRGIGTGDGANLMILMDPRGTEPDPVLPAVATMRVVESVPGPTRMPGAGDARYAWNTNAAAVLPAAGALVTSLDGYLYQWDVARNLLQSRVRLAAAGPQADTPTVLGVDGTLLAIAGGKVFAVGR